ncbi:hypothetical protein EVAR_79432_1 [Eumeta japonica]|uniref:Death domain-containing protein n=1 Tax=Eumeta variegata TaxID=151549 RepID=A0A4C1VEE0_EUMVA|nr:hypothetical protein EVAR_79432_1 [Eumeta japonica]
MTSIKQMFAQTFRTLKPDAVPKPPRPENNENINENDSLSDVEEVIIPPSAKAEKKKSKDKNTKDKKDRKSSSEAAPTIHAQAGSSVYTFLHCDKVHWGPEITFNFGTSTAKNEEQHEKKEEYIEITESIQCVMKSNIKAEHEYIDYVSKNLSENWRSFFLSLGYSSGQIATIVEEQAHNGISEARYQLLLDWVRNDDDGTLGRLATSLWKAEEREVVKHLALIYERNLQSEI